MSQDKFMNKNNIYKILRELEWEEAQESGQIITDLDKQDGFIHLSTASQLAATLAFFFKDSDYLQLLQLDFQKRLLSAIPGGAHTYSRGYDQFSSNTPPILDKGRGAYVFDNNSSKFLDYGMALRAVTLGYSVDEVNQGAIDQIYKGNNLTRPSNIELEAAEMLIDLIPSAEMVKFAKNGSNVTTAALKLARSYTKKQYICVPRQHPFFSFDDWFIGTTQLKRGIPASHHQNTLLFDYGDLSSLKELFVLYPDQIAAVMLEPATTITPYPPQYVDEVNKYLIYQDLPLTNNNFLKDVEVLCKKYNSVFILDEMITGFRWHLKGAQYYFDVSPDLTTFGKAMANGFSLSALVGRREIMELGSIESQGLERTFLLSSTHGAEMASLGAFVKTVDFYKNHNVCRHLWQFGKQLRTMLTSLAKEAGLQNNFKMLGPDICLNYVFYDNDGAASLPLKTLFQQEMINHNVLIPWISPSYAHQDTELEITGSAARAAFEILSKALHSGVYNYLKGDPVKPVFRKYN